MKAYSRIELLEKALNTEMETIRQYNDHAETSDDAETKKLFRSLASQKYEHYLQIEKHLRQLKANNDITDAINSMFL
jgi:rubrerythrin